MPYNLPVSMLLPRADSQENNRADSSGLLIFKCPEAILLKKRKNSKAAMMCIADGRIDQSPRQE